MTSKLTVKANKLVRTEKITHPRKNESKKSGRSRVDGSLQSIYILLETWENKADNVAIVRVSSGLLES